MKDSTMNLQSITIDERRIGQMKLVDSNELSIATASFIIEIKRESFD
jgi:hypothetical protein